MIRTIIVDDESKGRAVLNQLLQKYCPQVEVIASVESAELGIKEISDKKPDLVFLDIEMPFMGGFEMLENIQDINFEVIFVTAFDHYAIKAFKFSAIDYLLKPIDIDELKEAVAKVEEKLSSRSPEKPSFDVFFSNLKNIHNPYCKIALPTRDGLVFLQIREIVRCESESNYTNFFLQSGEKIMAAKTLKDFEDLLSEYNFFRVHKSHLINLNHIKRYVKGEGGSVVMADNSEVQVSRRNKESFLQRLSNI